MKILFVSTLIDFDRGHFMGSWRVTPRFTLICGRISLDLKICSHAKGIDQACPFGRLLTRTNYCSAYFPCESAEEGRRGLKIKQKAISCQ